MYMLAQHVRAVLRELYGGRPPSDQRSGTAFSIALMMRLRSDSVANPVLWGRRSFDELAQNVLSPDIEYVPKEFMIDYVFGERITATKLRPVIACESEMHESHGVGYSFDPYDGYTWDCRKLCFFPAPVLLFTARVSTPWMSAAERSLMQCAQEHSDLWTESQFYFVLLPSDPRKPEEVRIGYGSHDRVAFRRLKDF